MEKDLTRIMNFFTIKQASKQASKGYFTQKLEVERFNCCFTSERGQGYLNLLSGVRL